jgi:hypothetical protein
MLKPVALGEGGATTEMVNGSAMTETFKLEKMLICQPRATSLVTFGRASRAPAKVRYRFVFMQQSGFRGAA